MISLSFRLLCLQLPAIERIAVSSYSLAFSVQCLATRVQMYACSTQLADVCVSSVSFSFQPLELRLQSLDCQLASCQLLVLAFIGKNSDAIFGSCSLQLVACRCCVQVPSFYWLVFNGLCLAVCVQRRSLSVLSFSCGISLRASCGFIFSSSYFCVLS